MPLSAEFQQLDSNIRAYSTILFAIGAEKQPEDNPMRRKRHQIPARHKWTFAGYNHTARLLSSGAHNGEGHSILNVAVTGTGPTARGLSIVVTTDELPRETKGMGLNLEGADGNAGPSQFAVRAEHVRRGDGGKQLSELGSTETTSLDVHSRIASYAAYLLDGYMGYRDDPTTENLTTLKEFVQKSDVPSMRQRMRLNETLWEPPLTSVLKSWTPTEEDDLKETFEPVPNSAAECLKALDVSFINEHENCLLLNKETVQDWVEVLTMTLSRLQEASLFQDPLRYRSISSFLPSSLAVMVQFVSYTPALKTVLQLPSLVKAIQEARDRKMHTTDHDTGINESALELDISTFRSRDDEIDALEEPVRLTFKYLKSLYNWFPSFYNVLDSPIMRTNIPIDIFTIRMPPMDDYMTNIPELLENEVFPVVLQVRSESEGDIGKKFLHYVLRCIRLHDDDQADLNTYRGKVHAEASLMALTAMFSDLKEHPKPWAKPLEDNGVFIPEDICGLFKNSTGIIGTGKKCCWCCDMLAFHLAWDHSLPLYIPEPHNRCLPWASPPFGVSLRTLRVMESCLREEVQKALCRLAEPLS